MIFRPRFSRLLVPTFTLLACLVLVSSSVSSGADDEVKLTPVKWTEFRSRLAANPTKAKFTLVDVWATNCGPCRENFPHLVAMHHKYGTKGLAVASLSLDDISDPKALAEARRFLKEKKAVFTNFLMNEEFGVGFEKLEINAIPAVFLYGPDGKEVKRFTLDDASNQFTYEQVEKDVASRLEAAK